MFPGRSAARSVAEWCAADPGSRAARVDPGSAPHRYASLHAAAHPGNAYSSSREKERSMTGWRARLGFLVPPGNPTVEPEMIALAPEGVTVHFSRLVAHGANGSPPGHRE